MASAPTLYITAPGQDTALLTAQAMLERYTPDALARAVVLLPNRRAAIALRDGFLRATEGRALLLPRMVPLQMLDAHILTLLSPTQLPVLQVIPPAMGDWQRLCLLAEQVQGFATHRKQPISIEQALRLAHDLAQLQDAATRARINLLPEQLQELMQTNVASHWQESLAFLSIVTQFWPEIERAYERITEEDRTQRLLALLANDWRDAPPANPVWVVGSTGSQPTTAALMRVVAHLSQGQVVLAGVDWEALRTHRITATHPFFHVAAFIRSLEHADIQALAPSPTPAPWLAALGDSASWRLQPPAPEAVRRIRLIACQHSQEEARVISLLIREALENPQQRVALITPDESLMARVSAQLQVYGVVVDRVSRGALAQSPAGRLWLSALEAIAEPDALAPLLHWLRHPAMTIAPKEWVAMADKTWRDTIVRVRGEIPLNDTLRNHPATAALQRLVERCEALSKSQLLASHWLTHMSALLGECVAVAPEASDAVNEQLAQLSYADGLGTLSCEAFASLVRQQLAAPWRQATPQAHPNVFMLTPVEARLMAFDVVILGNMQANLWPGLAQQSPWLNRAQQQALGLPSHEERVALMAHDVLNLGSAACVTITWPQRANGQPTDRSPFLERLVAYLALHGIEEDELTGEHYLAYVRRKYEAQRFTPATAPTPKPASTLRPRRLRVTALDALFSDPYRIYAEYILGLKELPDIDAELEAKIFGTLTHAAIKHVGEHWQAQQRPATSRELEMLADASLAPFAHQPAVQCFWRARLIKALAFVNESEMHRRPHIVSVQSEHTLEAKIGEVLLHGRIDRLEQRASGYRVGDYKTGDIPSENDILGGKANQLLAYALIVLAQEKKVEALEYWQLPKANAPGEVQTTEVTTDVVGQQLSSLRQALADMLLENTAFLARPVPGNERYANPYDGISRYDEWAG